MPTVFVGSAAAGTPYLVGDQSRGKGIVGVLTLGDDGALSNDQPPEPGFTAVGSNPTAIITYPGGLIVSDETYGDDANSSVWSATLDGEAGGCTITAGGQVDSGGRACCHLALHPSGMLLAAANYLGEAPANDPANRGTLSIFRVGEQGLGERTTHVAHSESYPGHNAARQEAAHIHSTAWAPMDADGKTALLVCDLGSDKIWQYVVDDASGVATPNPTAAAVEACTPGAGPRHICMSMSGKFGYVICEMGSVVQGHSYDSATGTLSTQPICTIPTTPPDEEGKFLYGSNRGHDSIVIFAIDPEIGVLTYVANEMTGGMGDASGGPRDFAISPCGSFLVVGNQDLDTVAAYSIDAETGKLTKTSELEFPAPVAVLVV